MRFLKSALGFPLFLVILASRAAEADPVRVVAGQITLDSGNPAVWGFTTDSFQISAIAGYHPTEFAIFQPCWRERERCQPGMSVDVSANVTSNPLNATEPGWSGVRLNGVDYPDAVVEGHFIITGPLGTLPPLPAPLQSTTFVLAGLTLDARLVVYPDASRSGEPLLSTRLFGAGSFSTRFFNIDERLYWVGDSVYRFQSTDPVPEPATMLLVGSALTGLVAHTRRRRSART